MTQTGLSTQVEITTATKGRPLKLDPTAITKLEKGTRAVRLNEAVAIAAALDHTVDEMLRPALPPEEQLEQARRQVDVTDWRARWALGEYEAAKARAERLRKLWEHLNLEGGGKRDVASDDPDDVAGERYPSP